ncbi:acetylxylan esterase [Psychromonas sp.]|uniref:acetylxylan esterase n=1 Tax=Psychromonas sp. TaxID=1884585 RepID=UPI0035656DCC
MPDTFQHDYDFDPSYGYDIQRLLKVETGKAPVDFAEFWQNKYQQALQVKPYLSLQDTGKVHNSWRIYDCYYDSTEGIRIGGWLLLPTEGRVDKAIVWAHGYGGVDQPDSSWQLENTALLIPCIRGIGRSAKASISNDPYWHVLHNIQDKHQYIIAGCVQDLWCAVSALLNLFPQVKGHIGLIGTSFGGGLGVLASAFDKRICRSHFHVPAFGNAQLRMTLQTVGSTKALLDFAKEHPEVISETLPYFDASVAARYLVQPTHWALGTFDPVVAPPGQFSIYNSCTSQKQLYLLQAGHFVYRGAGKQRRELRRIIENFFAILGVDNAS